MNVLQEGKLFVGRSDQIAALDGWLAETRDGHPRVVLLTGPAGIGKTALLDHFLSRAGAARVLRGSGEQAEASLAYGVADQILRAAGDAVLGAEAAADHVSTGLRLLTALGGLRATGPVIVVVDDAHWADAASLKALLFAARRLVADQVLVLVAARDDDIDRVPPGLRRLAEHGGGVLRLAPLAPPELQQIAAAEGVELPARGAARLHAHTEGNPLHALALLHELPPAAWHETGRPLPVPRSFSELVVARLDGAPAPARRLATAAAVLGARAPFALAARLARVGDGLHALEDAVDAGLLCEQGQELGFPHPLVESAIYGTLRPAERARLHHRAASMVENDAIALRHLVAAASGPDEGLAAELEHFARGESQRGAWRMAAVALRDAARLTADHRMRDPRLLAAAEALSFVGDTDQARRLAERIDDPALQPQRDGFLAYLAVLGERPRDAWDLLDRGWATADPQADPHGAARIAHTRSLLLLCELRGAEAVEWARRALDLPVGGTTPTAARIAEVVGLIFAGRFGEAEARARDGLADSAGLALQTALGWALLARDDLAAARPVLEDSAAAARRLGWFQFSAATLGLLTRTEFLAGRWDAALLHGERALALLAELPNLAPRPAVWTAVPLVSAFRGEPAPLVDMPVGERSTLDRRLAVAIARALPASARGDHAAVIAALGDVAALGPVADAIDEPSVWPWQDLLAEALAGAGRPSEADVLLRPYEARVVDLPITRSRLARVRGQVEAARGDAAAAAAALRDAIEQAADAPFERARAQLALGGLLRRQNRRRDAAVELRAARETLAALRARPDLERCDRELAACGLAPGRRDGRERTRLTPQERSVAELVVAGKTNREVAGELIVSVKTVEVHLTRIYNKLGVSSRAQLAAVTRESG